MWCWARSAGCEGDVHRVARAVGEVRTLRWRDVDFEAGVVPPISIGSPERQRHANRSRSPGLVRAWLPVAELSLDSVAPTAHEPVAEDPARERRTGDDRLAR